MTQVLFDGKANILSQGGLAHARKPDGDEEQFLNLAHLGLRDQVY